MEMAAAEMLYSGGEEEAGQVGQHPPAFQPQQPPPFWELWFWKEQPLQSHPPISPSISPSTHHSIHPSIHPSIIPPPTLSLADLHTRLPLLPPVLHPCTACADAIRFVFCRYTNFGDHAAAVCGASEVLPVEVQPPPTPTPTGQAVLWGRGASCLCFLSAPTAKPDRCSHKREILRTQVKYRRFYWQA